MAEAVPGLVRAGRPRSRGGRHFTTSLFPSSSLPARLLGNPFMVYSLSRESDTRERGRLARILFLIEVAELQHDSANSHHVGGNRNG